MAPVMITSSIVQPWQDQVGSIGPKKMSSILENRQEIKKSNKVDEDIIFMSAG